MSFHKFKKYNTALSEPHAEYLREMFASIKEKDPSAFEIIFLERKKFPHYPKVFYVNFENLKDIYLYYSPECEVYVIRQFSTNKRWEYRDFEKFAEAVMKIGNILNKKICDVRDLGTL